MLQLLTLVAAIIFVHAELFHLTAENEFCDGCNITEVCRRNYIRWNNSFLLCPAEHDYKCHPSPRPCTSEERGKYCTPEKPFCTVDHYHYCVDFDKKVVHAADFICSVSEYPCKTVGFIPSYKYCHVRNERKFVNGAGVIEQTPELSNEDRACGNGGQFCKKEMSCWTTLSLVLADSSIEYYTETCAFQKDPCKFKKCPKGKVCAITTKFLRESPDLCTEIYGRLCMEVKQVQEVAVCQDPQH